MSDTSHLVIVTAQIPNLSADASSNINTNTHSASVEFRTLASKTLSIPQNFTLERDAYDAETFVLSWNPVCIASNAVSNGIPVGGYSIYLDGIRLHQILNPTASTVNLTSKLLFNNGAKLLTIRTLGLDGNTESKDSEPIKLVNFLNSLSQVNNNSNFVNDSDEKNLKPSVPFIQQSQLPPVSQQQALVVNKQLLSGNTNLITQNQEAVANSNITSKKTSTNITSTNQYQSNDEIKVCFIFN